LILHAESLRVRETYNLHVERVVYAAGIKMHSAKSHSASSPHA
jgi:hypothetical protein